jgi:hypothetical protein
MRLKTKLTLTLVTALAAAAVVIGPSRSRANSPCRSWKAISLTASFVELREGGQVVGADQAVLDEVPRFVCVRPMTETAIAANDCWVTDRHVTATLEVTP